MVVSEFRYNKDSFNKYITTWKTNINQEIINKFFIRFTYYSNKIVNKEISLSDVDTIFKDEAIIDLNCNDKSINEMQNYKEIYEKFFQLDKKRKEELSIDLIKRVHCILNQTYSTQELIKNYDELQVTLKSLIKDVNNLQINGNNVFEIVGYFYCWFIRNVIPYLYNDERLAMILINYILIQKKFPPIIFFESDTEKYHLALKHFNETDDIAEMVNFLEEEMYKTWVKNYSLRLKKLEQFLNEY